MFAATNNEYCIMEKKKLSLLISAIFYLGASSYASADPIINDETRIIDGVWDDSSTQFIYVGFQTDGRLIVKNGGEIRNSNLLQVGRGGAYGQVDIIDGGKIHLTNSASYSYPLAIGGEGGENSGPAGGVGVMNISGVGSQFISDALFENSVGSSGAAGYLTISNGGKMILTAADNSFNGLWIGSRGSVETQGTVVVDGVGSELYSESRIIVGTYNQGAMTVSNGATVTIGSTLSVGRTSGTLGTDSRLVITGQGSSVTSAATADIGYSGKGVVVISDGGRLDTPNMLIGYNRNSVGEVAIGAASGETAAAAGTLNTSTIRFGNGTGRLVFNHTNDEVNLSADIISVGQIHALSGTTKLSGNNSAFQGAFTIAAPAELVIEQQDNLGANSVINDGTLRIVSSGDWNFINQMSGAGVLSVDTGGNRFSFDTAATIVNFNGGLRLDNTRFDLSGVNSAALNNNHLTLGNGAVVTVGQGRQTVGALSFDGGTLSFGQVTPGQTSVANTVHSADGLDISGAGSVQIDVSGLVNNDRPNVNADKPLLQQDSGNTLIQLAASDGTVTGNGGSLALIDQQGNLISDSVIHGITQNGQTVANATYDYRLSAGDNNDGLYVSYGLTEVALQGQGADALLLDAAGATGNSADLSAKVTGTGDLAIDTGVGQTVTLSNLHNDYQGVTDLRSGGLAMLNDGVLGNTSLLQLAQDTVFDMNGYRQTVGQLIAGQDSSLRLNGGALTIENGGRIDGGLSGAGNLILSGGSLAINGANQGLSATTTIASGADVSVNHIDGLGSGDLLLSGELAMSNADGQLVNNISENGRFILNNSRVVLAGNNADFSGEFSLDADSRLVAAEGHLGSATVNNDGELVLNALSDWQAGNRIQGTGSLTKIGVGAINLSGDTTYSGATDIQQGGLILGSEAASVTLASGQTDIRDGAFMAGFGGVDGALDNAGTLYVGSHSGAQRTAAVFSIGQDLVNSGVIHVGASDVARSVTAGNQLYVGGNYQGNDGHIYFNSVLGGDGSLTDRMVIDGDSAGVTYVSVNNAGGSGAQTINGIELITVNGQSDGDFIQEGRIVAGAYDYSLVRGSGAGSGNWYLTSRLNSQQMNERPEAGAYISNLAEANTLFINRLHDRLGETHYLDALSGEQKVTSFWLRQIGGLSEWQSKSGQLRTKTHRYVAQMGGDLTQWSRNGQDRWHLGAMAGYGTGHSRTVSNLTEFGAKGHIDGYSAGLYATWYQNNEDRSGWYADGWVQYNWFNNRVSGDKLAEESYKSKGFTASFESGYTLKLTDLADETGRTGSWYLRPHAQAVWMGVKAADRTEANGTRVSAHGDGNVMTRLGLRTYMTTKPANDGNTFHHLEPFAEVNWIHNSDSFSVEMNGVSVGQAGARNIGEVKLGLEGQYSQCISGWGNIATQFGANGYRDNSAMLGMKYSF
jgi:autotransporter family porin